MFSTRDLPTFDYDLLDKYLGNKTERKICNLTYAVRMESGRIVIQYESGMTGDRNTIATYRLSGSSSFTDACWQTVTTKQRLNQLLPNGLIYQHKRVWYYSTGLEDIQLNDGFNIEFNADQFVAVTNN